MKKRHDDCMRSIMLVEIEYFAYRANAHHFNELIQVEEACQYAGEKTCYECAVEWCLEAGMNLLEN